MSSPRRITNVPHFPEHGETDGFQEVWYLKFNDLQSSRALWLRFTVLISKDQSKKIAEVWAIFFDKRDGLIKKTGVKETFPLSKFTAANEDGFHIGDNAFNDRHTSGSIENGGNRIRWEFSTVPGTSGNHNFIPESLQRIRVTSNTAVTVYEDLRYTGWCEVNGERFDWRDAPGMQGHLSGPKNGHSWVWGHCNTFVDEDGHTAPLIWDGLCARAGLGPYALPPLPSMFFQISGTQLIFNTMCDAFHIKSAYGYDGWRFTAEKSGFRFAGNLTVHLDDFAGVTYEDTNGSKLYCHNTKVCDCSITVTSPQGTSRRYSSSGGAAYEVVAREAHPQITFVI